MSSTITPSDRDRIYFTDDLQDRLDTANLEGSPSNCPHYPGQPILQEACVECGKKRALGNVDADFYKLSGGITFPIQPPELPPNPSVSIAIVFGVGEATVLDGSLGALSFGSDGWLCSVNIDDAKDVLAIAVKVSKEPIDRVLVNLPAGQFYMQTNIDCTADFSHGSASFTVTSDEACYV